jgi:hypothetical protein
MIKFHSSSWLSKIPLCTPVRIAIIKNTTNYIFGEDVGKRKPHTLLVGMQADATTLEKNLEAS